jgi:hypothetical protein
MARNGPRVELRINQSPDRCAGVFVLTEQMDLYIGVAVILMFLAGCFLVVVSVRERFEEHRRWRDSTAATPQARAESKSL